MQFEFTEGQNMLRRAIRDFAMKEIAPLVDECEERETFPVGLLPNMGELGYLGMGYPAEYGGSGMGKIGECILAEEVGHVCAGIAGVLNVQMAVGTSMIYRFGSEEQKQQFLTPLIAANLTSPS